MFNLSRHFSMLSLALIVLSGAVLGYFYYQLSIAQLVSMAEERNVAVTNMLHNTLWPRYDAFLRQGRAREAAAQRDTATAAQLHADVSSQMRGTDVIKTNIYNLAGSTVYSSDPMQIGEDQSTNRGLRLALQGEVVSELKVRNTRDCPECVLSQLDVLSSHVPIRGANGDIEGVFQLYQDVTPFVAYLRKTLLWIAAGVLSILGLLYLAQFAVVQRAHRILRQQEAHLHAANRELDSRVRARTQELEQANRSLQGEIAERRTAELSLDHLAHHDSLTGLPNRRSFNDQLARCLKRAERHGQQVAVLFIDLDHFKDVNDSLGHPVGDELLKAVAARLTLEMRSMDILARLGGDEFICLIEDIRTPSDAGTVAMKILEQLKAPVSVQDNEFLLTASIGISLFPGDGNSVDALVRNADTAMYRAKAQGRNSSHFYAPEMTAYAMERMRLDGLLRRSIENGEVSVHYQAQVDSVTGQLLGAEALARWTSGELGPIAPARFIPIAEETGFIVTLGEWVLREACRQMAEWDRQGLHLPKVSVNVSVRQIERGNILELVGAVLAETGLAPGRLELEITESVIMSVDDALVVLERLRHLGVQLSVDDFGTGYSSLSYIKRLPISKLKIDRSFVVGIGASPDDEAIIHTIVALARSLDLELIAEGVETSSQAEFLARAGCPNNQGYLHGRPLAATEFQAMLAGP